MRSWHFVSRRSKQSPTGRHSWSFGARIGYWPCLDAPFICVDFASHRFELWHGKPSYRTKRKP